MTTHRRFWVFSARDNSTTLNLVAVDDVSQMVVGSVLGFGARYPWQITVEESAQTVTVYGQANRTVVVDWATLANVTSGDIFTNGFDISALTSARDR